MPAPHPRMHGITHVPGGPDPIPGLLPPTGDILDDKILAAADMFWKLDETAGTVAHDSTGNGNDLAATVGFTAPAWGQEAGPPGSTSAGWPLEASSTRVGAVDIGGFVDNFTAGVWVNVLSDPGPLHFGLGEIIGQGEGVHGGGWSIMALSLDGSGDTLSLGLYSNAVEQSRSNDPIIADAWYMVAAVRDAGVWKLYVNGLLQTAMGSTASGLTGADADTWLGNDIYDPAGDHLQLRNALLSYAFIADRVMSGTELAGLVDAASLEGPTVGGGGVVTPGAPGSVLGVDEHGDPVWVSPPAPAVTVNGEEPEAAETPRPAPTPPPPPDTDPVDVLMIDQPFVYGGTSFTVQPKRWTTIPFTTPLMERMSDKTGVSAWEEIPVGDPDAGGWLHADSPHTITVAHDIPFTAEALGQVCLRIDNPIVEGATSHRALRILETTHQKTLLEVRSEQADGAGAEGGITDVFRGPGITVFASGDTGSTGTHPDIFFAPNFGLAFYPTGYDWLPYVDGVQSLTRGMRLVAQCWHDASVSLTFNAGGGTTYKPHFVLNVEADPAWGPPWSTWF